MVSLVCFFFFGLLIFFNFESLTQKKFQFNLSDVKIKFELIFFFFFCKHVENFKLKKYFFKMRTKADDT